MTCEGLRGDLLETDVNVDQWLHRLHFSLRNKSVVLGDGNEMDEAHVKDLVLVQVVKWVLPVPMVQMSVTTEHLAHDALAILVEVLREIARFSDPFLGSVGNPTVDELRVRMGQRRASHLAGGKSDRVMNLAHYPTLNAVDELGSRDLGRLVIDKPSIGSTKARKSQITGSRVRDMVGTYFPAVMDGQVASLQIGSPVLVLVS